VSDAPVYDALLADTLAQAREAVERAQSRAGLAEQAADLALAQARAQLAAASRVPQAVAALHRDGADGRCAGCGLAAPCPTARLVAGGLGLDEAQADALGQLGATGPSRVAPTPAEVLAGQDLVIDLDSVPPIPEELSPSEQAREPRHFLSGFTLPRRSARAERSGPSEQADHADGMSGPAPAVPAMKDLLGPSPGIGRFLDRLLGPP